MRPSRTRDRRGQMDYNKDQKEKEEEEDDKDGQPRGWIEDNENKIASQLRGKSNGTFRTKH